MAQAEGPGSALLLTNVLRTFQPLRGFCTAHITRPRIINHTIPDSWLGLEVQQGLILL